jgi:hypothetical protein
MLNADCVASQVGPADAQTYEGCYEDGPGPTAKFYFPSGVAVTKNGSVIYIADTLNYRIRSVGCLPG